MRIEMPKAGKSRPFSTPEMIGPIAVVCPTMHRPENCKRLVDSFLATTADATLFLLLSDPNDLVTYADALVDNPRVHWGLSNHTGGPVSIAEGAIHNIREPFTIIGMVPDDCEFTTPGWDQFLKKAFDKFPKKIGVVSAWHRYGSHVANFPWVTREWIEAVGWYWYPNNFHFCCDTILEVLGECSNSIHYCTPDEFNIEHHHEPSMNRDKYQHDLDGMFNFIVFERRMIVDRIKVAQGLKQPQPAADEKPWEQPLPEEVT